jgi:type VI secretion system protein ImpE
MSQGKALFGAAKVEAASEEVTRQVKAHPADASHRTFLFELLCFAGEWDGAENQLDAIG